MELVSEITQPFYLEGQVTHATLKSFTVLCAMDLIGKTKRHFYVRAYKHLGLSNNPKNRNNSGILEQLHHLGDCSRDINSFEIIGGARNDFFLCIKESLLIQKFKPNKK